MTQIEISKLLNSGFLLRTPSGLGLVGVNLKTSNSHDFSIAYKDFWLEKESAFKAQKLHYMRVKDLLDLLQAFTPAMEDCLRYNDFTQPSWTGFKQSFDFIKNLINKNELLKAVPIVKQHCAKLPTQLDRLNWLKNLIQMPTSVWVYGCWNESEGFMGATPEILYHRKADSLETMALAGTSDLQQSKELLKNEKELIEHEYVVRDICQQMQSVAVDIRVQGPEVKVLPKLAHLYSQITAKVKSLDSEVIHQLHPTAALGVYPRNQGYRWLKQLPDQVDRSIFGAPVLFKINETENICLVAIRNVQWNKNGTFIFAGCGIVKDSVYESEEKELRLKLQSIFSSLGMS